MRVRRTPSRPPAGSRAPLRSGWDDIYAAVRRIPRGRVASYGQVAELAGRSGHARQAGYALHALPEHTTVPWHRVVNAQGRLSLARLGLDAALEQRRRLEAEGVEFDARGRVRPEAFRWKSVRGQRGSIAARRNTSRKHSPRR